MRYKLLLLDIDGTLRPGSCEQIPKENAAAVRAVQKAGVKIAIATGRGRTGVGKGLLRDLKPDYWVCAGGAQLVDAKGNDLALHRLTAEEMYALVDFFEDYELPLRFTFHDANYAYIDFAEFDRRERPRTCTTTSWTARTRITIWWRCPSAASASCPRNKPRSSRKSTAISACSFSTPTPAAMAAILCKRASIKAPACANWPDWQV